jgi:hypothetical protein
VSPFDVQEYLLSGIATQRYGKIEVENWQDLSKSELESMAAIEFPLSFQARLNDLLALNKQGQINAAQEQELDSLLVNVDELNLLRAMACKALHNLENIK